MFIKQSTLFWGMDKHFVVDFMDLTVKRTYEKNQAVFRENDPADCFFILLKGHVEIKIGHTGVVVHNVSHAGGAFGWSSLLDRDGYTASAICIEPTTLLAIKHEDVETIVKRHPESGALFYKRLAGMLGQRLLAAYQMDSDAMELQFAESFGSRQMMISDI